MAHTATVVVDCDYDDFRVDPVVAAGCRDDQMRRAGACDACVQRHRGQAADVPSTLRVVDPDS